MSETVVYKYDMPVSSDVTIEMPAGAQILRVAHFNGQSSVWALVDLKNDMQSYHFMVVGTGMVVNDERFRGSKYIGSIIDGPFIWHVFSVLDPF